MRWRRDWMAAGIVIIAAAAGYGVGNDNGYRRGWDMGYKAGKLMAHFKQPMATEKAAPSPACPEGSTNCVSLKLPSLGPGESVRGSIRVTTFTADEGPVLVESGRVQADCYLRYCHTASGEWEECPPIDKDQGDIR